MTEFARVLQEYMCVKQFDRVEFFMHHQHGPKRPVPKRRDTEIDPPGAGTL